VVREVVVALIIILLIAAGYFYAATKGYEVVTVTGTHTSASAAGEYLVVEGGEEIGKVYVSTYCSEVVCAECSDYVKVIIVSYDSIYSVMMVKKTAHIPDGQWRVCVNIDIFRRSLARTVNVHVRLFRGRLVDDKYFRNIRI